MKRAQFVANGKMKNEKANAHTERLTPPGLEKSEMKDSHFFPHLFLKGELMRQFLMDEDVWLFIQNFKMKLKESPNDVDSWLDYQLHLARNNMGHLFHSDIPPFEHIKKNSESFSPKVDYEGDKNYGHPNEFAKRNDFSEQCGRSTCDDLGQLDRLTRRSGEGDESGEEDKTDGERKKDEKDEKGGDRTTSLTLGTSRVGINDILMRRLSQSEQERKGSGSVHVGSSIPTQKDDPHLGESKTRAESRHSPSGTAQRRSSSVGSDLQFSSERNDHTDGLTDENPKHHHSGEDMIIKKRHAGREEAKGGTNSYSGEDEECHEIMGRVQQPRERNHLGDEIFSPQRKAVMKSRYEVSTTPTQCSEKDDMMITFGETTLREDGTHWKGDDDYVPDGAAKGAVLQEGTPLGEDKPGDRSGRRLSGGKQRPGGSTSPVEEPLQGEVHNKAAPKKVATKQVATNEVPTNEVPTNEVPTNQGSETQHRAAAPIASKTPTEESPLPKKNKALEGSPHEEKQSGSDPTYNPSSGSKFPDKNKREVPIVIPKMTVTIDKLMNEETDRKLKKIFCQCDNKMDVDSFERLVVIDFLKIGRYMSHTLFSRIEKANEDFVTCEEVRKYFRNRFIDGTKDPSYYDDRRYRSSFERGKQGSLKSALHVATPLNGGVDEESANAISNLQNGATHIHCEEGAPQGDDGGGSQKGELTDVPYKKCSVINFFNAIKDQSRDYIEFKDFDVFVREILKRNTSLQFLHEHVEFLERYIESVIVRIYYHIDVNDTNRVYLKDLRKHNLAHIWCCLDDHIKVQHVKNYFSYSHFYVYYCTFCQTSSCKDMLIDDNDLYRFDNHSLNDFIVNRIWSRISIKLGGPNEKYMCLNDWIYFIMNYEDMTSNRAIEFWFKLIDLDADCVIRDHEIQVFFNIQMERLKSHYLEEPKFEDWLCQMNDAIQPKNEGNFTLSDFKRNKKYAARFFGCLVSLSKLLAWESRDVYKELQIETEFPHATPWEIFCKTKYDELCYMENEGCYEDNFDSYDAKAFYGLDSD